MQGGHVLGIVSYHIERYVFDRIEEISSKLLGGCSTWILSTFSFLIYILLFIPQRIGALWCRIDLTFGEQAHLYLVLGSSRAPSTDLLQYR